MGLCRADLQTKKNATTMPQMMHENVTAGQCKNKRDSHTHTHTHSLAHTAVADVVSVEHLTLYQRVLIIDFQKSEESF